MTYIVSADVKIAVVYLVRVAVVVAFVRFIGVVVVVVALRLNRVQDEGERRVLVRTSQHAFLY